MNQERNVTIVTRYYEQPVFLNSEIGNITIPNLFNAYTVIHVVHTLKGPTGICIEKSYSSLKNTTGCRSIPSQLQTFIKMTSRSGL